MKITAIKQQVKQSTRYSIFVDDKYAFGVSESALLELQLATGQELDAAKLRDYKRLAADDKAYQRALRYVAMRPRSSWEMRVYLQRKEVDEPAAEAILQRLQRVSLLDDAAFAKTWVANRRLLKSVSKRRLRLELLQKRVDEATIDSVLAEDETDENEVLRELVNKKRGRYQDKTKLMQYLARQGFSYDAIKRAVDETDEAD